MPALLNRKAFFDAARLNLFKGRLTQPQVEGLDLILNYWESSANPISLRKLAYVCATAFWESGRTMQPIMEVGRGKGHRYGVPVDGKAYCGRGLVQLTWRDNYDKMGKRLGLDLVNHPELALVPENSVAILFIGMTEGQFTGKKLSDYDDTDYLGMRKIVNGTDRDREIANYANLFYDALLHAKQSPAEPSPRPAEPIPLPPAPPRPRPTPVPPVKPPAPPIPFPRAPDPKPLPPAQPSKGNPLAAGGLFALIMALLGAAVYFLG